MQVLEAMLQRWGIQPGDIAGTSLSGEIALSESLINRQVAQQVEHNAHIKSLVVTFQGGDEALVRVEPRMPLIPTVPVVVRIEGQPDLPHDPTLRLRWSIPSAGPLGLIARATAGYLKKLPDWVQFDRDLIVIDLRALLRARGLEDALRLVRRAALHTRPGTLVVKFEGGLP